MCVSRVNDEMFEIFLDCRLICVTDGESQWGKFKDLLKMTSTTDEIDYFQLMTQSKNRYIL